MQKLIEQGADVNVKSIEKKSVPGMDCGDCYKEWEKGSTALSIAKEEGYNEIGQLLLAAGAVE